jgi:hypothetical protein
MSCCYYSADLPKVFRSVEVVARKQHTCCECGRDITKGSTYENVTGLWDDFWQTYKTCETCADLRTSVEASVCVNFGELYEAYEYLVGQKTADKVFHRRA